MPKSSAYADPNYYWAAVAQTVADVADIAVVAAAAAVEANIFGFVPNVYAVCCFVPLRSY